VALHATTEDGGAVVGVGRFVFTAPGEAELAITIGDCWQRQGLGAAMLDRLIAAARARGVVRLTGEALAANRGIAALLASRGFRRGPSAGVTVEWSRRV
jgi:GNAT superfamily N-acetyltransferase